MWFLKAYPFLDNNLMPFPVDYFFGDHSNLNYQILSDFFVVSLYLGCELYCMKMTVRCLRVDHLRAYITLANENHEFSDGALLPKFLSLSPSRNGHL